MENEFFLGKITYQLRSTPGEIKQIGRQGARGKAHLAKKMQVQKFGSVIDNGSESSCLAVALSKQVAEKGETEARESSFTNLPESDRKTVA